MAHHKRRRPKHQRAGCLMCKPWKDDRNGVSRWVSPHPHRDVKRLVEIAESNRVAP
jgi:hypothetical protein